MLKSIFVSAALCSLMTGSLPAQADNHHFYNLENSTTIDCHPIDDDAMNDDDSDANEGSNGFNTLFENESKAQNSHQDDNSDTVVQNV